jgi:uncharacterized membrane protein affecting hemolysin expression
MHPAGIGLVLILVLSLSAFTCNNSTKNLATASDAIAHALLNAQTAAQQASKQGIITTAEEQDFESYLNRVAQAGKVLDAGIKANENAATLSQKVNVFLDAFNTLNTTGIVGIKNDNLRLTIATIITGAETSVAIIAASVGGGK